MRKTESNANEENQEIKAPFKRVQKKIRWDRLDNTANLFPVIAGENMTNVYRICVTLTENIDPGKLQEALDITLPKFDGFNLRLRQGVFWYYFEENGKRAPRVVEEKNFPCRYIRANRNNSYLFRVTYYKRRINLEVFHVLTDGMGGINFLKELTYQYLRLVHPELREKLGDGLSTETTLNREDSFLKNYQGRKKAKRYGIKKAFHIKGERLPKGEFGVMHVYLQVPELKKYCHEHGCSINELLVADMAYSIYKEAASRDRKKRPVCISVPVNLRPFFESVTTKNFFVMVNAELPSAQTEYTFEEVLAVIQKSLKGQISKEKLEEIFSYNVSNQKSIVAQAVPLVLKNQAMNVVYRFIAAASTTTVTNIGNIGVSEEYKPYVQMFHAMLSVSYGQLMKGTICSYKDVLVYTFTSLFVDTAIQRRFCRTLSERGLLVEMESNGVYYE